MGDVKHTPGPWALWRGEQFVGGGEDICIGAGETWLANMDHRVPRCPDVTSPDGHPGDWNGSNCPICTIDSGDISAEQLANAHLIAAAPELLAACLEFVRKVESGEARSKRSYTQMKAAIALAEGRAVAAREEAK